MRIEIDINRSIKQGRIAVIKRTWFQYVDNIIYLLASSLLCAAGIAFAYFIYKTYFIDDIHPKLILVCLSVTFIMSGILVFYSLVNDNKFVRLVAVNDPGTNESLVQLFHEKLHIKLNDDRTIFRFYTKAKMFRWGKRIIIIRDQQDLLVNISRFNERHMKSPFHLFFDVLLIKSIGRKAKLSARKAA